MNNIIKRVWNQNKMVNIEALQGMTFQAESGGHTFQISGVNDTGASVPLSGTVSGVFMRPDRADIALTGVVSNGVASITLTSGCYAVPGRFGLTIFLTSGGQTTAIYAAVGTVSVTSGGGVAGDTPQDVVDLINAISAAVATIPASYTDVMAAFAPTYSSSSVYGVGSYAWYSGVLYRCVTAITTAETWTPSHWAPASIGADVVALDNAMYASTGNKPVLFSDPAKKQYIVTNDSSVQWDTPSVSGSTNIKWAVVSCSPGDVFVINGRGGNADRLWAFADASKNILSKADAGATANNLVLVAPDNSAYLILNDEANKTSYIGVMLKNRVESLEENAIARNAAIVIDDMTIYPEKQVIINSQKLWILNGSYKSAFVPVPLKYGTVNVTVEGNATNETYIAFLQSDTIGAYGSTCNTFCSGHGGRKTISANTSYSYTLPSDCKYVFVLYNLNGADVTPKITLTGDIDNVYIYDLYARERDVALKHKDMPSESYAARAIAINSSGHDIPQNRGVLNAYKKAQQFKDVPWTALSAVPGVGSSSGISAGAHEGLPYSSVKEYDKYVGFNVSLRTFMTAAHNPYSLLYTEDVNKDRTRSSYGKTYYGTNCGAYFGIVCNVYALYSLGWAIPWNTGEWEYLCKEGILQKAGDQSAYGMRRGDIVWEPGHGNIIVDIMRDQDGTPTSIVWAESISQFPVFHSYTISEVNNRLSEHGGIIYYYPMIHNNTEYNPSDFVAVDGETIDTPYTYNDDICTFAGDYACFHTGEDIYINYTAGSYTQMQVYKDDALIDTVSISPNSHSVKITDDGYGMYKARLTDGTNYSDYTYFEIVDTTVSSSYSDGMLTVNFSSDNGTPLYAQLTYRDGESIGIIPLDARALAKGSVTFSPVELQLAQHGNATFSKHVYIKVFFKGQYGVVVNDYIDTNIIS